MCKSCEVYLLGLSKSDDWKIAEKEWVKDFTERAIENTVCCGCATPIRKKFHIKNKETGKKTFLGSTCIDSYKATNKTYQLFEENKEIVEWARKVLCKYCKTTVNRDSTKKHIKTEKHIKNKEEYIKEKYYYDCEICSKSIKKKEKVSHLASAEHKDNLQTYLKNKACKHCDRKNVLLNVNYDYCKSCYFLKKCRKCKIRINNKNHELCYTCFMRELHEKKNNAKTRDIFYNSD